MRIGFIFASIMASTVILSSTVFAGAWYVPTNTRIVQKSNTDTTGRVYSTIQSAINSITNASATNPYVVKVMPGVYDLGTASLQMKPFVDVEGSGPDNTVITSANSNVDGSTCTVGTVLMASDSSIRNIKVVNRAPDMNGDYISIAALVFNNVAAKAEGITVVTGNAGVRGGQNNGVCTYGSTAHAILNNINVETYNLDGQSNAIEVMGGKVTLTNSKLTASNGTNGSIDIINNNYYDPQNPASVTVVNSTLEGTCAGCFMQGITADGGAFDTFISNSFVILNNGAGNAVFNTGMGLTMENTKITSNGNTSYYIVEPETNASKVKIATSLLPGDRAGLAGTKVVNCFDGSYNPIPNQ